MSTVSKKSMMCAHVCSRCDRGMNDKEFYYNDMYRVSMCEQELTLCQECIMNYRNIVDEILYTIPCHTNHTPCKKCHKVRCEKSAWLYRIDKNGQEHWGWYCFKCTPEKIEDMLLSP